MCNAVPDALSEMSVHRQSAVQRVYVGGVLIGQLSSRDNDRLLVILEHINLVRDAHVTPYAYAVQLKPQVSAAGGVVARDYADGVVGEPDQAVVAVGPRRSMGVLIGGHLHRLAAAPVSSIRTASRHIWPTRSNGSAGSARRPSSGCGGWSRSTLTAISRKRSTGVRRSKRKRNCGHWSCPTPMRP